MPEKIARNRKGKGGGWERVARSRGWLSRWGATTERDSRLLPSTLTSVTYKDRPTLSPPPSSSFSLLPPSTHPPTPRLHCLCPNERKSACRTSSTVLIMVNQTCSISLHLFRMSSASPMLFTLTGTFSTNGKSSHLQVTARDSI